MAQAAVYPKFRADSRDGFPLSGGKIYSYASGTTTPKPVYADAELTQPLTQPLVLDASGEALFYYDGSAYALELRDQDDVPQWVIDPVIGGFGGSTGIVGLGIGSNTVLISPTASTAQASGLVFPPNVLAMAVTVTVSSTFGTSQGLGTIGVGFEGQPDAWGVLETLTATTASDAGYFLAYGSVPQPESGVVTLTAYGGTFDGAGAVYVTGHFFHFSPSETVGYRYLPGTPEAGQILPPMPPATETQRGAIELATQAEVTTGTDAERAVTPATLNTRITTLNTALNTRVPPGTALSVARYASGGVNLETSPLSVDASSNLRLGTVTAGTSAQRALVVASGVAPSAAHPVDAVQMWVADFEGTAGQAALHVRSEDGTLTRMGRGITGMMRTRAVTANGVGSPLALTADMSGMYFICQGAAEQYLQLPAAISSTIGCWYRVSNHAAGGVRVIAQAGHTIQLGATVTATGGFFRTITSGNYLLIVQANSSYWFIMSPVQNWGVV
jgi:hypothetical protein